MKVEFGEAKPWHCGQLTRTLRPAQSGAFAAIGVSSHRELRARFMESSVKRAWFIDGELAALFGITGPQISTTGIVWLALSEKATRLPKITAIYARRELARMMEARHEVFTLMFPSDAVSMRWVEFLGFEPVGAPNQDGTLLMVRRNLGVKSE